MRDHSLFAEKVRQISLGMLKEAERDFLLLLKDDCRGTRETWMLFKAFSRLLQKLWSVYFDMLTVEISFIVN